ncbi:MAG: tRNA threonylcarbamoyladenosine dehydratase [Myxococcales bacterium]|nr:tRNA threonylcarbamoyladenosine dehydratase [Myxococcales bacterium]
MQGLSFHGQPPPSEQPSEEYKLHRRFDRMGRLVGDPGMARLKDAFVVVMGLGGVGSFAAESLARSGVGRLRIVDFDDVCVTNVNRQLHALKGNIGKPKATLMAERLRLVNPQAEVEPIKQFYQAEVSEALLDGQPDFVVDAIDQFTAKCHLIATCKQRGIPLVTSMGAAGRIDPTRVKVADLNKTSHDRMAENVRRILRQKWDFPRGRAAWGIPAVFTDEPCITPHPLAYEKGEGFRCVCPQGDNGLLSCDRRARIDGSASFVTGTFGLVCASVVVRSLVAGATAD